MSDIKKLNIQDQSQPSDKKSFQQIVLSLCLPMLIVCPPIKYMYIIGQ